MIRLRSENLVLDDGAVSVQSDNLPWGTSYEICEMNRVSSRGDGGNMYDADLRGFHFNIGEKDLDQSLDIEALATAKDQRLTLEKLVLSTGRSVIEANGYANLADTSLQFGVSSTPVYWSDIACLVENYPVRENVDVMLSVSGNPEQFNLGLSMDGDGIRAFEINSRVAWQSDLVVEQVTTTAESIDLAKLLADTTYPRFQKLSLRFNGQANITDLTKATGELSFSAADIKSNPYQLQKVSGSATVDNKSLSLTMEVVEERQKMAVNLSARDIWSEQPLLKGNVLGVRINPGYWVQDTTYDGSLTFNLTFDGKSWYLQKEPWKYNLSMPEGVLVGHSITNTKVNGVVGSNDFTADGIMNFHDGRIEWTASLRAMTTTPLYEYRLKTEKLDLDHLLEGKNFSTSLNGLITGKGTGFDPSNMQLQSRMELDSSIINGEKLDTLFADFSIRDSVVTVDSARLKSGIADGLFNVRMNILDRYNVDNELFLDLRLKDLSSLAPLANATKLQASGDVTGTLSPFENNGLRFLGKLNVNEIAYDSLFAANHAQGSVDINVGDTLFYLTDLNLQKPIFSGIQLQNLSLKTRGDYRDGIAQGQYDFQFSSSTEGRIEQSGTYRVATDSIRLNTNELNFISDYRTLTLEESFELWYQNESLRMDTLRISSGDGSFLEVGLPIISPNEQRGFVKGNDLNTSVIQSSLLGETFFKGMLSGQFEIDRRDADLEATGDIVLSEINFEGADFDSLTISTDIAKERMEGTLTLKDDGDELIN